MASSMGARIFGFVVLLACLAVLGGGGWYFFGRDLFAPEEVATDDDTDDVEPEVDGGAHHARRPGKRGGKGGKKGRSSKAPGAPKTPAASYGPPGRSYESAIAGNHEQIAIGATGGAPDLTDGQLAGPMRNATFLGACGAPDSMHVTVKVAIRSGRAVGVSVYPSPPNAQIAACIDHSVRDLAWPVNAKMDSFVTTY